MEETYERQAAEIPICPECGHMWGKKRYAYRNAQRAMHLIRVHGYKDKSFRGEAIALAGKHTCIVAEGPKGIFCHFALTDGELDDVCSY